MSRPELGIEAIAERAAHSVIAHFVYRPNDIKDNSVIAPLIERAIKCAVKQVEGLLKEINELESDAADEVWALGFDQAIVAAVDPIKARILAISSPLEDG